MVAPAADKQLRPAQHHLLGMTVKRAGWLAAQCRARILAAKRRIFLLFRGEYDPFQVAPIGMRLSPSESHFADYDTVPLSLSWSHAATAEPAEWQQVAREKLVQLTGYRGSHTVPTAQHVEVHRIDDKLLRRRQYLRVAAGRDVPVTLVWSSEQVANLLPVMICLQGTNSGAHLSWGEVRMPADPINIARGADIALQAARRGYLAVCVEQSCFGERRERHLIRRSHTPCIDAANHALLLGRCLVGERTSDVSAVVDWLLARDHGLQINAEQLHIMGNSSGGTTALYTAALDERITAVLSCSCIGFVRDSIACRGDSEGQNVIPGILQWLELDDVIALCAPRPFLTVSGRVDHIWPYNGAAAAVDSARRVYRAMDAGTSVSAVPADGGHGFYPDIAWPAFEQIVASA